MDLAIAIIGAAAAVAAAIAALGSWKAARKSNDTAGQMASIEHQRRHQELTPDFDITLTVRDTAADSADLRVALKPGTLLRLDQVGDHPRRGRQRPLDTRPARWSDPGRG